MTRARVDQLCARLVAREHELEFVTAENAFLFSRVKGTRAPASTTDALGKLLVLAASAVISAGVAAAIAQPCKPAKQAEPQILQIRKTALPNPDVPIAPGDAERAARGAMTAISSTVSACFLPGDEGDVHVQVQLRFEPSGRVSDVGLTIVPEPRGTERACMAQHYRAARISRFAGSSITVDEGFFWDAGTAAIAAANIAPCKSETSPRGWGQATVTFEPRGTVSKVEMSEHFLDTPTGECLEKTYRAVKIKPFLGHPIRAHGTFSFWPPCHMDNGTAVSSCGEGDTFCHCSLD